MTNETKRERVATADHNMKDEKGRAVGGFAIIELRYSWSGGYNAEGVHEVDFKLLGGWMVAIQATRDGKSFGASASTSGNYPTREAALEAAHAGLVKQGQRYAKKFAAK